MTIKINGTNTAANPSITGTDTDTGIVYGSDQIDFSLGGSSKVFLNSSGNQLFTGNAVIGVNSNSSNLYLGGGSNQPSEAYLESGTLSAFKVGGSEAARIDSNLNLGLGTTTPTEKLSIYKYRSYNSDAALYQTIGTNNGAVDNNKVHQWRFGLTGNASSGSSFVFSNLRSQQSTYTEELRLHPDGGISFNGDTAAANALDDYEEGTWTPSNPNGGYTFSNTAGYYTKIGNMVHWFLHAVITLVPNNNNLYEIYGLPYTSSNANHNYGWHTQVVYTANSNDANIANMRALVEKNASYVYFHTVGLGTGGRMFNSTFRNGMQGETLIVAGTYMAA